MERMEIINEYINYCIDLGIDATIKSNRKRFVGDFMEHYVKFYGISKANEIEKQIKNTLMYNPPTIAYLFKKRLNKKSEVK